MKKLKLYFSTDIEIPGEELPEWNMSEEQTDEEVLRNEKLAFDWVKKNTPFDLANENKHYTFRFDGWDEEYE